MYVRCMYRYVVHVVIAHAHNVVEIVNIDRVLTLNPNNHLKERLFQYKSGRD